MIEYSPQCPLTMATSICGKFKPEQASYCKICPRKCLQIYWASGTVLMASNDVLAWPSMAQAFKISRPGQSCSPWDKLYNKLNILGKQNKEEATKPDLALK